MIRQKQEETAEEFAKRLKAYEAVQQKAGESEEKYYKRLAKMTDTRMGRLEELSQQPGYESVLNYAYRKARRDLEIEGLKHFEVKLPKADNGNIIREIYNERINTLKEFLTAPTSTKGGIKENYQNKADAINKNYGTNFTWNELADYFNKGDAERLSHDFASKTALLAIGKIQKMVNNLDTNIKENLNITMSEKEKDVALDILRHGSKYIDLGKRGSYARIALRNQIRKM